MKTCHQIRTHVHNVTSFSLYSAFLIGLPCLGLQTRHSAVHYDFVFSVGACVEVHREMDLRPTNLGFDFQCLSCVEVSGKFHTACTLGVTQSTWVHTVLRLDL